MNNYIVSIFLIIIVIIFILNFKENNSNIIMTTYFCKKKDPQRNKYASCSNISYIKPWYYSLKRLNLNGIVFYDNIDKEFIKKYQTKKIKFIYVDSSKFTLSVNDQRYLIYYNYLLNHPEIKNVFMTDGNDVTIVKSPFDTFNNICVGSELDYIDKSDFMKYKILFLNKYGKYNFNSKKNQIIYNAGILGGPIKDVLPFLKNMNLIFSSFNEIQRKENLNMIVFNYVIYNMLNENVITGENLHSKYKYYENERKDIYFIHK